MTRFPSDDAARRRFLQRALGAAGGLALAALPGLCAAAGAADTGAAGAARRTVIIDCDPGQDDAIALLLALGARAQLDVRALTVVAGNVPLALTERNARIVRDWAGRTDSLPVFAGCARPMQRELITAANVHGRSGLDGTPLHTPRGALAPGHAVAYLVETLRQAAPRSVTLCALGPLTNLGAALVEAPEIAAAIREIVLMGGAWFERGNITPAAEFNIYVDPHAARLVFDSGVPIVVLPRDVAVKAPITAARIAPLRAMGNRAGAIVADIMSAETAYQFKRRGVAEAPMYDPCATAYLIDPALFRGKQVNVAVETLSDLTLGETVVDWTGRTGRAPNALWITDVDADGFYAMLAQHIATLP